MAAPQSIFDRGLLTRRRNRIAATAASHDFLLQRAADDMAERLSLVQRRFATVLVLGAHHGVVSRMARTLAGCESVVSLDSARQLLAICEEPRVEASEEALPFAPETFDLVLSAHALETVNDVPGLLAQTRRILRPDGLLLATFAGGATLTELRQSWLLAESELTGGASPRVAPFAEVREAGAVLQRVGFALPVADSDTLTVTYATPLALMAELKAMGMSNMLAERSRTPVTRRLLLRAAEVYVERFGLANGRVPATFEIITLTGWAPHESQQKPLPPGSAQVRLADALAIKEDRGQR